MKNRVYPVLAFMVVISFLLSACQGGGLPLLDVKKVVVSVAYGSEKKDWLEPLVTEFNAANHKNADGTTIVIEATPMGSIESVNAIISGEIQPVVWSPASSVYIPVANSQWRKTHADDLITGSPKDLVLSPVVIAMWKPMAEALGWPSKALGWADIGSLAASADGWNAFGYPEWGSFKFGHTHPSYSNSGIVSIIAEAYAGVGKQRDLTLADLSTEKATTFMTAVESSVIHYGTSTGFFADRMFERGPSYLSAAVLYENLIVAQESKRIAGSSSQLPVVAIYPKEGTFWSNHPYVVLNAPWVTAEQKEAAAIFQTFLLDRPQQLKAMELGFRPADPSIPLTAPLDAAHGVDINQPQTVLEIPTAEVIDGVQNLWKQTKKVVDLVVVMDTSGSMGGEKIAAARSSLMQFIQLLDDKDRLQVIIFNTKTIVLSDLTPIGEKRQKLLNRVSGIVEEGGTRLYDTALEAYKGLEQNGDPKHIRAMVVLTDGQDTESNTNFQDFMSQIDSSGTEAGLSIKMFTIAFGSDADKDILKQMAEATGGKQYDSDPKTITKIYGDIATFF